ncbi:LytTR family transcriptional regulator [Firmicutes bacterium AF25-13AC]|nr:LytTR family transcriptional regulator [Firmicutes bacterium AF25-13AC]
MRYTINKINKGEDELILNYKEKNPEVEAVLLFMDKRQRKLIGRKNDETIVFTPEEILYIEKVDNKTFVYTDDNEIQVEMSLYSIELFLDDESYFRCSKSMIINVNKVEMLKVCRRIGLMQHLSAVSISLFPVHTHRILGSF